jgi:hypothetical protein
MFENEREGCPCRVNGVFTGGSAALIVREFLKDTYNNHWCGHDGPIPWPSKSPDLTPPDIFVWEYVKLHVYGQDHRMKLTSDRRSPRALHRSLWKCCAPRDATFPRHMKCAASAMVVMLSVNVLGHRSGVPPTCVHTINW